MVNTTLRHQARRVVLIRLFCRKYQPEPIFEENELIKEQHGIEEYDSDYCETLIQGIKDKQNRIDELIIKYAPEWGLDQVDPVDLSCLRIAFYELVFQPEQVPLKVVIDEAVELAKEFGGENSASFVNGVLGSYVREEFPNQTKNEHDTISQDEVNNKEEGKL